MVHIKHIRMDNISGFSLSCVMSIFFLMMLLLSQLFIWFIHQQLKKEKVMEKKEKGVHMRAATTKRGEENLFS